MSVPVHALAGPLALDDALPAARAAASRFFAARRRDARLVVYCHFDADGLAAGALFGRVLDRMGFRDVHVVASGRSENAFSDGARERLRAMGPDALVVTDLGVRAEGVLPEVPTLYVDHHQPAGLPTEATATVVTGYGWDPMPCSAWLAWELLAPLAQAAGVAIDDLQWLAAVGTISDLGEKAPWPELAGARKRWTAKWLKEAVVLTNAARRATPFDVETPLALLLTGDHPRALSEDEAHGADRLRAYRSEVNAALAEARKAAPVFAGGDSPWALVRLHSSCQIHPLIAQQWRGRLPRHAVIAANTGYLPDLVAFSARTARTDLDLPALLRATRVAEGDGRFGNGHDQASGGHLAPDAFAQVLRALGFPEP